MIPNLFAVIRLQELQDREEDLLEMATDEKQKMFHRGRIEAFSDAAYVLKYATCYTKDGFDKELARKLSETIYFDGNKRYTKEDAKTIEKPALNENQPGGVMAMEEK